jgi:predicted phosphodiesterase
MSLTIQYVSDVHLERHHNKFSSILDTSTPADVLVLAGDIGCPKDPRFKEFLNECKSHFATVIFVPGNHEYYSCYPDSLETTDSLMGTICKDCNVVFLNGTQHQVGNVNFIGSTLWSHIHSTSDADMETMNTCVFRGIKINENTVLTVESHNNMFRQNLLGIEKSIQWGIQNNLKNVVITHHAPYMKAIKSEILPKNYMYATELSQYLSHEMINTWIYGHTHWNTLTCFKGTLVTCNQFGGPKGIKGWRAFANIQIG